MGIFKAISINVQLQKHTDYNAITDWMEKIQLFDADFRLKNFLLFPISKKS